MSQRLVFSFLVVFTSLSFAASTTKTPVVDPNADQAYSVPVESTGVQIGAGGSEEYNPNAIDWAIGTSMWTPNSFNRPSLLQSNSNFTSNSVPQISLTRIAPITYALGGVIESEMGASYSQLSRTGLMANGSGYTGATEEVNLASVKIGVGYRAPNIFTHYLQPAAEISLLPTWVSSEKNQFEAEGISAVGVVVEASISLLYCPDFMQKGGELSYKNTGEGIGLGYTITSGTVGGSDLSGGGVEAILRLSL
jgi:hypothetical protein